MSRKKKYIYSIYTPVRCHDRDIQNFWPPSGSSESLSFPLYIRIFKPSVPDRTYVCFLVRRII